ncbi:gamma carbonic anhydrase family protein [bacterium]|nr:gamma carbonic anhydrase family protein [bacterium]
MESTKDVAGPPAFVAPSAAVSGEVALGRDCSLWHNTTLRGDLAPIAVGARSNIQDGAVLHVETTHPCVVGEDVTVGHGAIVHGCKIGDRCLIGMGAIILNGAEIGDESVIGAGALVTEGKKIPPRSLALGMPAKVVRSIGDEEVGKILENAASYLRLARQAAEEAAAPPAEAGR